eukprot:gene17504-1169_t
MTHEGRLQYWTSSVAAGTLVDMNGREFFVHSRVLRDCGICERVLDGGEKGAKGKGYVSIVDDAITERRLWKWEAEFSKRGGAPVVSRIWRGAKTQQSFSEWEAEMQNINGMDWHGGKKVEPTSLPNTQHKIITWRGANADELDQQLAEYVEPANRKQVKAETQEVRPGDNIIATQNFTTDDANGE